MMQMHVPALSIVFMVLTGLVTLVFPLLCAFIFVKKLKTRFSFVYMLVGALMFIIFAMTLEQIVHIFAIPRVQHNFALYTAYACLMAGLFEETGRYAAFKLLHSRDRGLMGALSYGVGHGGAEAVLIVGLTMFNNIVLSFSINTIGVETLLNSVPVQARQTLYMAVSQLSGSEPALFLIGGVERMITIPMQIALSVIVYIAVSRRAFLLYPFAVCLHAASNIPAVFYQTGKITIFTSELIIACAALITVFLAVKLWKSYK